MKADDVYAILSRKIRDGGGGGSGGTTNYNYLTNKPMINSITLQGNLTLEDLGLKEITNAEVEEIIKEIGGI